MTWKVELQGKIDINATLFNEKDIVKSIEKETYSILADHSKNYDTGKAPDGSSQKANSSGYALLKATKGVQVGRQKFRGSLPTVLTGDMKNSRKIKTVGSTIEMTYEGSSRSNLSNSEKANFLVKKGYKLNYLSDKNVDSVLSAVSIEVEKQLQKAIKQK